MSTQRFILKAGEKLLADEYLVSENKIFFAIMQTDGNFCVYAGSGPSANYGFLWSANPPTGKGDYYATIRPDGNFCIYKNGKHHWSINQSHPTGNYCLVLQNDGKLCIYHWTEYNGQVVYDRTWLVTLIRSIASFSVNSVDYDPENTEMKGTVKTDIYKLTSRIESYTAFIKGVDAVIKFPVEWQNKDDISKDVPCSSPIPVPIIINKKFSPRFFSNQRLGSSSVEFRVTFRPDREFCKEPVGDLLEYMIISANLMHYQIPYTMTGEYVLQLTGSKIKVPFSDTGLFKGVSLWDGIYVAGIPLTADFWGPLPASPEESLQ